ncbi:MAG: CRTAC1 family protein [Saprospiraceae bacterium]
MKAILAIQIVLLLSFSSCKKGSFDAETDAKQEQEMIDYLEQLRIKIDIPANNYATDQKIRFQDSLMQFSTDNGTKLNAAFKKANYLLEKGNEFEAIKLLEQIAEIVKDVPQSKSFVIPELGVAYLRLAERTNCANMHMPESCVFPIQGMGIHRQKEPALKAIAFFEEALTINPNDLNSRWLLNIAFMTVGTYPTMVPKQWLIPGMDDPGTVVVKPFKDIASQLGIDQRSMAGGTLVDDFNNDGFLDIIFSHWGLEDPLQYFQNNGDGTFSDMSEKSRLNKFKGGLNLTHMDYNNDGWLDIFILRGAWQGAEFDIYQPNSLIRNNGDGTYTDVTKMSGIFSELPTQTCTWNDFNKDGWIDVFIGNESMPKAKPKPCELYLSNKDGTFTNVAVAAGVNFNIYAKAVSSGDYDNDGWPDLFISTMGTQKVLLRNTTGQGKGLKFELTSDKAGMPKLATQTFPAWFFDYDNDGWLDIFYCNYEFEKPLSYYACKEALSPSSDPSGKPVIFHNNKNGTFTDVTHDMNINQVAFSMGANFGDFDNDGFLDMYLGTGNPYFQSLLPNRLYKNMNGTNFEEVTVSARVGQLQKGHAIAFADVNQDGHQDIIANIGGAYVGDSFFPSFYLNPGQNNNHWIKLQIEGVQSNRLGIGAKIKLKFKENGKTREVFREVNTGGSFGCSPYRREIGIGTATVIDELVIEWPVTGKRQVFKNVKADQYLHITEDKNEFDVLPMKAYQFKDSDNKIIMCDPVNPSGSNIQ